MSQQITTESIAKADSPFDALNPGEVLNLAIHPVHKKPFEHVLVDGFVNDAIFKELQASFPDCPSRIGPTGYSCYWGEPEYDELIATNPAWRAFFRAVHSQEFVDWSLKQFAPVFTGPDCVLDLSKAEYVPFCENRENKERAVIVGSPYQPHQLWCRLDIHQGKVGYFRRNHLDHRRRLISMLVYFCDAEEDNFVGGDLVLHNSKRILPWGKVKVKPRRNRMAVFACHKRSWHSVPEIMSQTSPRNHVQIVVSSSVDAWTT